MRRMDKGTIDKICQALAVGAPRKIAALHGGICEKTLYRWITKGKAAEDGPYLEFWTKARQAEAKAAVACLAEIQKAARYDWKAAAWFLERRFPDSFGSPATRALSTDGSGQDPSAGMSMLVDAFDKLSKLLDKDERDLLESLMAKMSEMVKQ